MDRFARFVRSPGHKPAVSGAAPTQRPAHQLTVTGTRGLLASSNDNPVCDVVGPNEPVEGKTTTTTTIAATTAHRTSTALNRWLDVIVHFGGSQYVFLLITAAVIAWAFLGISFGTTVTWAVVISNVQAIVCYIFDSLLMRQYLLGYEKNMKNAAVLQSRLISHTRMIRQIIGTSVQGPQTDDGRENIRPAAVCAAAEANVGVTMWMDRLSDAVANFLGHMAFIAFFWVCIIVWLAFGPSSEWSNEWQLYINSSTSALMLFTFACLANIHERDATSADARFKAIFAVDEELEVCLRQATGDADVNPMVTIAAPTMSRGQRAIFYYADFVGTLTGVAIMLVVIIAWLAIGPALDFSDNWWLLIGTYAGLIGMHDGFVLENMQTCLHAYMDKAMVQIHMGDAALLQDLSLTSPNTGSADAEQGAQSIKKLSWADRISCRILGFLSHPGAVLCNVLLIIGLIIGASAMQWTVTGQLLCNVPPSIIESFMMLIVITGHNLLDEQRRGDLQTLHQQRLVLLCWAQRLQVIDERNSVGEKE